MIANCKIIRELAKGGQKTVFLAEHPDLGKVVIKTGQIKSFTSLERIKREIELLAELNNDYYPLQHHFNIDIITKEFQIVEQYIEGEVLRHVKDRFTTPKEIFTLLQSMIKGLQIIWDKNIVHRDLKPENIIIRPDGRPCIIDLGIARFLDLESLTQTIAPLGPCTPVYAAPEQLTNQKTLIDHRTDFFSIGIIALELYLQQHPFDLNFTGDLHSIVENILRNRYLTETATVKTDLSIQRFSSKTLQTQPYQRFRTYKILLDYIANYL